MARPISRETPVTTAMCLSRVFSICFSPSLRVRRLRVGVSPRAALFRPISPAAVWARFFERDRIDHRHPGQLPVDALGQPLQHLARTAFDHVRDAFSPRLPVRIRPSAHWIRRLAYQRILESLQVRSHRPHRRCSPPETVAPAPEPSARTSCRRSDASFAAAMNGMALRPPAAAPASRRPPWPVRTPCPPSVRAARDHHLRRGVEVDRFNHADRCRLGAHGAHSVIAQPRMAAMPPSPTGTAVLHGLGADAHQRQRISECQRAGSNPGGVFAKAVTCGNRRAAGRPRPAMPDKPHIPRSASRAAYWSSDSRPSAGPSAISLPISCPSTSDASLPAFPVRPRIAGERVEHADRLRALAREKRTRIS